MSQSQPIHNGTNQLGTLKTSDNLLICKACGTQYDTTSLSSCRICDDPRQFVPASGQSFTTMSALRSDPANYRLAFSSDESDPNVTSIRIEPPELGIGQRALLIRTPHGNVLWDLVCYLSAAAVDHINSLGGLSCIVISHPHFYTTWADWSATFNNIPVYLAKADEEWICRRPAQANLYLLGDTHNTILPGVTAIVCGGHFPGSMALHSAVPNTRVPSLFHADTIHSVPNGRSPDIGEKMLSASVTPGGVELWHTSYTFMWSYPNLIPLSPKQILGIWRALKGYRIEATYGFATARWEGKGLRIEERILESMKRFVRNCGWDEQKEGEGLEILRETVG